MESLGGADNTPDSCIVACYTTEYCVTRSFHKGCIMAASCKTLDIGAFHATKAAVAATPSIGQGKFESVTE